MTKIHLHAAMPGVLSTNGGGVEVTVSGYEPSTDAELRDTIGAATIATTTILTAGLGLLDEETNENEETHG
jgi:hypothetical protein